MSEMMERVARAMYEDIPEVDPWDELSERSRNCYRSGARAAIEAMREPTLDAIEAGANRFYDADNGHDICTAMRASWQAMIDETLK